MADKNIQLQDMSSNNLYPKTKGSLVTNNSGATLGTVESGAQVNKIETIKVNGTTLSVVSKAVDITLPEYTIAKAATATSGYSATYYLTKAGTQVGESINIPKDMVVQSGSVKTVTTANSPVSGYKVGDKYIDLVLANADNSHIYILVSDLIDTYTAGTGISISSNAITNTGVRSVTAGSSANQVSVDTGGTTTTITINNVANATNATNATNAIKATQDANGNVITSTYATITTVNGKADKATTLAGYGITDAIKFTELV